MFKPIALFIGLRYTRAKRRNHFISFISLMSVLGIALGVLVLITVLSVMNGFDKQIKERVFSMVPAITVGGIAGPVDKWQALETRLEKSSQVTAVAPVIDGEVLLTNESVVQPALIKGIIPQQESKISALNQKIIAGKLSDLIPGRFNVVLGENLADRLNVSIGDKVVLVTPQSAITPAGIVPRFKRFTVVGIFHAGNGFGFDSSLAFINLSDAQRLFQLNNAVTGLQVNIHNVYSAPEVSRQLARDLPYTLQVMNWADQFGAFFQAVSLEKNMMFFILLLIIAVAVFNLVSTLVMVVNEKKADIAILRTIGATPRMILQIFMVQGVIIGVTGTLLGVIGGIALALNVTQIVNWIQQVFHVQLLSSSVYFVDYLPSELQTMDIVRIASAALFLSLIATLYPAWRASRTEPVEALRYE